MIPHCTTAVLTASLVKHSFCVFANTNLLKQNCNSKLILVKEWKFIKFLRSKYPGVSSLLGQVKQKEQP